MTRIVDPLDNQELSLGEGEELVNLSDTDNPKEQESVAEVEEQDESVQEEQKESFELPDKYKDKPVEELVRMHQEAEKLLGRQGAELGQLRKGVDDLLKTKLDEFKSGNEVEDQEEDFDFYENPKEAVNRTLEKSETIQQMKQMLAEQQQAEVLKMIENEYPDYRDTIQNENFVEWIKASKVRTELLQRADKYDLDAALELLGNWKELKGTVEKVKEVNEKDLKLQRKAASTGGGGSSEPVSRKIYRRTDLVNLMRTNPRKYMANVEEYDRAYAEGRVK
jgi:hypothetical protein